MNNLLYRNIFLIFISFIFISCASPLQSGIKQIQVNMDKQEVVSKLGTDYKVVSIMKTDEGDLEVLRYATYALRDDEMVPVDYYYLHFLNGRLVEMHHEDPISPIVVYPPHEHH